MNLDSLWMALLLVGPLGACVFLIAVGLEQSQADDDLTAWLRDSLRADTGASADAPPRR